jgi:hypothetical protein
LDDNFDHADLHEEKEKEKETLTKEEIKELIRQELVSYGSIDGCAEDGY